MVTGRTGSTRQCPSPTTGSQTGHRGRWRICRGRPMIGPARRLMVQRTRTGRRGRTRRRGTRMRPYGGCGRAFAVVYSSLHWLSACWRPSLYSPHGSVCGEQRSAGDETLLAIILKSMQKGTKFHLLTSGNTWSVSIVCSLILLYFLLQTKLRKLQIYNTVSLL